MTDRYGMTTKILLNRNIKKILRMDRHGCIHAILYIFIICLSGYYRRSVSHNGLKNNQPRHFNFVLAVM